MCVVPIVSAMHVCANALFHARMCEGHSLTLRVFLYLFSPYCFETKFLTVPGAHQLARLVDQQAHRIHFSLSYSPGVTDRHHCVLAFMCLLRIQAQSLCL